MHGRFTSPDEFKGGPDELFDFADDASENPTFYADIENPQSLNKCQYGYNNPYKFNDPTGHCPPCAIAWAVVEVATAVADVVVAVQTVRDPDASKAEKIATVVGAAASVSLPGGGYGIGAKAAARAARREAKEQVTKKADDAATSGTRSVAPQKADNLRKAEQKGIPRNRLGPSGKPKIHTKKVATNKRAKDYARNEGQGPPKKHNNPKKGCSHWHSTDKHGNKKVGKDNIHVESRRKQRGELN